MWCIIYLLYIKINTNTFHNPLLWALYIPFYNNCFYSNYVYLLWYCLLCLLFYYYYYKCMGNKIQIEKQVKVEVDQKLMAHSLLMHQSRTICKTTVLSFLYQHPCCCKSEVFLCSCHSVCTAILSMFLKSTQ